MAAFILSRAATSHFAIAGRGGVFGVASVSTSSLVTSGAVDDIGSFIQVRVPFGVYSARSSDWSEGKEQRAYTPVRG